VDHRLGEAQFEVGKGRVGRREGRARPGAAPRGRRGNPLFAVGLGLVDLGSRESPILGPKGNREFFAGFEKLESRG
jgi:23S rRNA (cytidine1920-2'-O)/16S rRNA (cytidine1409-2'-O)-methyltransferase